MEKGLVILNTGNGKGKTTSALGMMMRAWGNNMKVVMLQFIKRKNAHYGEIKAALKMNLEIIPLGDGFINGNKNDEKTISLALQGWEKAKAIIVEGSYDIVILDEFTFLLHFNWLDVNECINWLKENKPSSSHLIITGRNAPPEMIEFADLVTEMIDIKHPFRDQGISAQIGIEY
jgi:cob(I)alamin adenosyltransferase